MQAVSAGDRCLPSVNQGPRGDKTLVGISSGNPQQEGSSPEEFILIKTADPVGSQGGPPGPAEPRRIGSAVEGKGLAPAVALPETVVENNHHRLPGRITARGDNLYLGRIKKESFLQTEAPPGDAAVQIRLSQPLSRIKGEEGQNGHRGRLSLTKSRFFPFRNAAGILPHITGFVDP